MQISIEEAEDIIWDENVILQEISKHRWYTKHLVVFEKDGQKLGFYYLSPATEMQEGQGHFESDPVEIFPVIGEEHTYTKYRPL
jgi:hypothetical protein